MKHKLTITIILLAMFLVTQVIGLFVINAYLPKTVEIINPATGEQKNMTTTFEMPYGLQTSDDETEPNLFSLLISFILAIAIISIFMKYQWKIVIRIWFLVVVIIALAVSIYAILNYANIGFESIFLAEIVALAISIPLAIQKIFRPSAIIHNLTELLIYPGISVVFIPILTPISAVILLMIISLYDMWAVWKSGFMQRMAKFQMEELKIFGGFLLFSTSKKVKEEIKNIKQKYIGKKIPKKIKNKKFKVSLAILGGGDVVFPLITAGVFLKYFGLIPALFVTVGAFASLVYLMVITKKDRAYPAMPYISVGVFLGIILSKILGF